MSIAVPTESDTMQVVPWDDPIVDAKGFRIDDPYVEMFWLPVLGPTATWLLRRLVSGLASDPQGYSVDMGDLARGIGVVYTQGRHNPFGRALHRCVMFGAAQQIAAVPVRAIAVRRHLPTLPARHLARLPEQMHIAHADWLSARRDSVTAR